MTRIRTKLTHYDVIVIIRGGGATTDLSCFDDYALAAQCAVLPLPVLTGIGHTRDVSLLDMVAYSSLKTPTAVAAFLIDRLDEQAALLHDIAIRLTHTAGAQSQNRRAKLEHIVAHMQAAFVYRLQRDRMRLDMWEKNIATLSPERIMHKGYAIVLHDGKVVKTCHEISAGDSLTIEWHDGSVNATASHHL